MRTLRFLALAGAGWVLLVLCLLLGFAGLATAVEQSELGVAAALTAGLWAAPVLVLPLSPLCAALGAALLAARLESRGEWAALQALGWSPQRSGLALVLVGLVLGAAQWGLVGPVGAAALARSEGLLGQSASTWVWLGDRAVRPEDGAAWRVREGRLEAVEGWSADPETMALARMRQQPRAASHAALRDAPGWAAQAERQARLARVLSAAAWAWLAWLPLGGLRGSRRVGLVLVLALGWSGLDLALQAAVGQHILTPLLGGWGGALLLLLACGLVLVLAQRRTRIQ